MPKFISLVGVILIFLSVCYCIESNPPNVLVRSPPPSSSSSSSLSSSSASSAKVGAGVSENEDKYHGNSEERRSVGMESGGRPRDLNWLSAEPIRRKRSASSFMNGRRQLDSVEMVPEVVYDRRTSRLLHPGDVKYIYDSGYETALDNPNGQAVVGSAAKDNGLFGWRNPAGIGDDGASGIWKTYQELSFLNDELNNPEPVHHQTERKRKWKSKNMAMWG